MKPRTKCKYKRCENLLTPPEVARGFTRCASCRARNAARIRELMLDPARHRKRMYQAQAYRRSQSPKAIGYRHRNQRQRVQATRTWIEVNAERRAVTLRLARLIEAGWVVKPRACQKCSKECRPVGLNIRKVPAIRNEAGVAIDIGVDAWVCWKCWWDHYRKEGLAVGQRARTRRRSDEASKKRAKK